MKHLITLLFLLTSLSLFAQVQSEKITVNVNDLPPDLLQELKQKQQSQAITTDLKQYNEWAGVGKEIGIAVKEGLTAVKDVAVDFSKTEVGTFTMVLIAWKVVGKDALGLFTGVLVFFIGVVLIYWSYRKSCIPLKICTKDEGWFKAKEYKVIPIDSEINLGAAVIIHGIAFFILVGIVCGIIF